MSRATSWKPKAVRADWGGGFDIGGTYGGASYGPDPYVLKQAEEAQVDVKAAREQATEMARSYVRGVVTGAPRMVVQLPLKAGEGYAQLLNLLFGNYDAVENLAKFSPAGMVGKVITDVGESLVPHGEAWDPTREDLVKASTGAELLGEASSPFVYQGVGKGIVKIGEALPKGSRSGSIAPEMLGLRQAPPRQPVVGQRSVKVEAPPPPASDPEALAAYRAKLAAEDTAKAAGAMVPDRAAQVAATRYANAANKAAAAELRTMQEADAAAATAAYEEKAAELTKAFGRYPAYRHAINVEAQTEAASRQMLVDQLAERGAAQAQAAAMQEANATAAAEQHAARAAEITEAFSPEGIQAARTARRLVERGAREAQVAAAAERELTGTSHAAELASAQQAKNAAAMQQASANAAKAAHIAREAEVREAFTRGWAERNIQSQIGVATSRAAARRLESASRVVDFVEDPVGQIGVRMPEAPLFMQRARAQMWKNMFPEVPLDGGVAGTGTGSALLHYARAAWSPMLTAYGATVAATGGAMLLNGWENTEAAYMDQALAEAQEKVFSDFSGKEATPENMASMARSLASTLTPEKMVNSEKRAKLAMAKDLIVPHATYAPPTKKPALAALPSEPPPPTAPQTAAPARSSAQTRPVAGQPTAPTQSPPPPKEQTPAQKLEGVWASDPEAYEAGVLRWMKENAADRANAILLDDQKAGRTRTELFARRLTEKDVSNPATRRILFGKDKLDDFEFVAGLGIPDEYFTGGQ